MGTTLREIKEDDLEMIMNWRMDPDITRYMNTDPKLTIEGQKQWLQSIRNSDKVQYWLIEQENIPVGVINLADIDWKSKTSSWGYYIGEKKQRTLKLAISLEMSLYDYVFDVLEFNELHNEVFSLNSGVVKLHLACGCNVEREIKNGVQKNGITYDITKLSITKNHWYQIRNGKKYERIDFTPPRLKLTPHHVGVAVYDIRESLEKYKLLGYDQISDVVIDDSRNIAIAFVKNQKDQHVIELITPMKDKSPVTKLLKDNKNIAIPYHVCYKVNSIKETVEKLKSNGFILTTPVSSAIAFDNKNVVFMLSREVGLVELLEE